MPLDQPSKCPKGIREAVALAKVKNPNDPWFEDQIGGFFQQYSRKKRKGGGEPNDRHYDHRVYELLSRLPAEDFDRLLNGTGIEPAEE